MEELDRLNIAKNTIVIFMADNGHEIYYSKVGRVDKPYRNMKTGKLFNNITTKFYTDIGGDVFNGNDGMAGLKRSNWQGGVDVPFVIKWPGHIKKGTINHNLTAVFDLLPTFADLLDVKVSKKIDGKSFLSELLGQDSSQHRKYVAFSSFMGPALVTNEGWKLRNYAPDTLFQLYYLPDDYREENNVAAKHPLIVKWLKKILLEKCNGNLDNGWFKGSTHLKSVN
jgi:arylsulfatase A-like enzyme